MYIIVKNEKEICISDKAFPTEALTTIEEITENGIKTNIMEEGDIQFTPLLPHTFCTFTKSKALELVKEQKELSLLAGNNNLARKIRSLKKEGCSNELINKRLKLPIDPPSIPTFTIYKLIEEK